MAGWMLMSSLFLSSVAISLCDYLQCKGGDVTLTANQCTDPMEVFNSSVRVLPGTNVTLNCSVVDTGVQWDSSVFTDPIRIDSSVMSANESGITFQFGSLLLSPVCSDATATISNIQDSMDGLDVRCFTDVMMGFSSTVLIDVIDVPGSVTFATQQLCNGIMITWNDVPDDPCPIIGYKIDVDNTTVSLTTGLNSFNYSLGDGSCGSTYEISMYAISAAGMGSKAFANQLITCTPTTIGFDLIFYDLITGGGYVIIKWTNPFVPGVDQFVISSGTCGETSVYDAIVPISNPMVALVNLTRFTEVSITSLAGSNICFCETTSLEGFSVTSNENTDESGVFHIVQLTFSHNASITTISNPGSGAICSNIASGSKVALVICTGVAPGIQYGITVTGIVTFTSGTYPLRVDVKFTISYQTSPPSSTAMTAQPSNTASGSLEITTAVAISVSTTMAVTATVTVLMTLLIVYLCVQRKKTNVEISGASAVQKSVPMSANVAYLQHKSTAMVDVYDNVAL